jgi:membrane fusion protein, multidrug efflux system
MKIEPLRPIPWAEPDLLWGDEEPSDAASSVRSRADQTLLMHTFPIASAQAANTVVGLGNLTPVEAERLLRSVEEPAASPASAEVLVESLDSRGNRRPSPPSIWTRKRKTGAFVALAAIVLLATGLTVGSRPRDKAAAAAQAAKAGAPMRVVVAPVEPLPAGRMVSVVGDVRPLRQVTLYAKVSGYLKEIRVDKGDKVTKNEVLAVLDSPDTDQLVASAEAEYRVRMRADRRARQLHAAAVTSEADLDRVDGDFAIASAELSRLRALKAYATIVAPFDGVITARYADPGALVQAATSAAQTALPLAEISDLGAVRITVYLGAYEAPFVHEGTPVTLWTDSQASRRVEAKITRTTRSLDARTRTLECEVELPNPDGQFTPGDMVHVNLVAASPSTLAAPVEAIFLHKGKTSVMTVDQGRASLKAVEIGDDDGKKARILSGVHEGELVALHPAGEVTDGSRVEAVVRPPTPGPPGR